MSLAAVEGRSSSADLVSTYYIESAHPRIVAFAEQAAAGATDERERAVKVFYAVRDRIRYDPYSVRLEPDHFRASACLRRGSGFCITKSVLLAAAWRAVGLPSRLGFADVRNHLATERLRERMGTDLFVYHGYTDVELDGRWVKATPAFNIELCERFGVLPLDFDGIEDSIFHPFDADGQRHMEYVNYRGQFDDLPFEAIRASFLETYPDGTYDNDDDADFHADAAAETAGSTD